MNPTEGKKGKKKETAPKAKGQKVTVEEDKVLAWMREQGDKEIKSTALRDAFGLKNRAVARRIMKSAKIG